MKRGKSYSELPEADDTITLTRIFSAYCQVCGKPHAYISLVYFVPMDNNLCCLQCAEESGYVYETRIFKAGD